MAVITNNDIARSIYLGAKEKKDHELSLYFKNVVRFLVRRRLLSKAPQILYLLQRIINEEQGVMQVKISSGVKLENDIKNNLLNSLKKRYGVNGVMVSSEIVDKSLLGGVRIQADNEVIDLTTKKKIGKLKEYLIRKNEQ